MYTALLIGAGINLLILVLLGGLTVYHYVQPEETELKAPPPLAAIEPPVVKYNQKQVENRQKSSQRPRQQSIKARSVSSINTPSIDIQVSASVPSVDIDVANVDVVSKSTGLTGGSLQMGVSAVDFFGIKSQGERVVIILDVARSMLDPARGDVEGYAYVKQRLVEIVDGLNSATLFNLIVFSNGIDVMSNQLVLANRENKERAKYFIEPYWKTQGSRFAPNAKRAVFKRNYVPDFGEIKPLGGSSRMDMALLASFEMGADAIFMITDGTPSLHRAFTDRERKEYERRLDDWQRRYDRVRDEEKEAFEAEQARHRNKLLASRSAENQKRLDQGRKEIVMEGWQHRLRLRPPWGWKPRENVYVHADRNFVQWMRDSAEEHYPGGRNGLPSLNIVGYSIPEEGRVADFLDDLRRKFPRGRFEIFGEYREDQEV